MAFLFVINIYSRVSTDPVNLVGILCCLCSLLFCASPLTLVSEVIRTKSTEKLPFGLIFSSFLVTLLWFLYGYLTDDGFIQFPNAIGALISGVQLILFIVYPSKRKSLVCLDDVLSISSITFSITKTCSVVIQNYNTNSSISKQ